ncbi:MAG: adenylate cyclase [Gammaproteobacteria bacterium]|jgi:adenylate cyclase
MNQLISKLRTYSGVVLVVFVTLHLLNHSMGIVSIELAEAYRKTIGSLFQTLSGQILLYGSITTHFLIALRAVYLKSSFKLKAWQWGQLLLGLSFPPLIFAHVIGTRGYDLVGSIDPSYYTVVSFFSSNTDSLIRIACALTVIWGHILIGLHFWLRTREFYRRTISLWYLVAILIPTFAIVGVFQLLRSADQWLADDAHMTAILAPIKAMPTSDRLFLANLEIQLFWGVAFLLLMSLVLRQLRLWLHSRQAHFVVTCINGKTCRSNHGISLLDALKNANIPHVSICGGRARCTTCRVRVGAGCENLEAPTELEAKALKKISAPENVRLACQLFPQSNLSITALVEPGLALEQSLHSGGVQGHEEYVVAMFVDMRGSTSLGERVMAYDVVYVLNQFFIELSESLSDTNGHYAQFAGDGLMALYGLDPKTSDKSCLDALRGAANMFHRIEQLNQRLTIEFGENISMGVGIHGGEAIVGTMGPPKTPLLTAVGDNINIAARLESQTKSLKNDCIVSQETLDKAGIKLLGSVAHELSVRGRDQKVLVSAINKAELMDYFANESNVSA